MLAKERGIVCERLLLFSLLITIQETAIRIVETRKTLSKIRKSLKELGWDCFLCLQVLEAFEMGERSGNFAGEEVVREIESLKLWKPPELRRYKPRHVVILKKAA